MSLSGTITSTLFVAIGIAFALAHAMSQPARYRLRTICRTESLIALGSFGILAVWTLAFQYPVVSLVSILVMGTSSLVIAASAAVVDHRLQGNPA